MKIELKELNKIVRIYTRFFKPSIIDLTPYINPKDSFTIFKSNSSETLTNSFSAGRMKGLKFYGVRLRKNMKKKFGYENTKIKEYVESRDYEDNQSGEMIITTIYKIQNKKRKELFYISCRNVIKFPVLVVVNDKKNIIPLFPYLWETYLYAFDDKRILMEYFPDVNDCIYAKDIDKRDEEIRRDAFVLFNFFGLRAKAKSVSIHDSVIIVCDTLYPYCLDLPENE